MNSLNKQKRPELSHKERDAIMQSGAANLSNQEKFSVYEHVHTNARISSENPSKSTPLFFGSWTGMNPFRFVKPFFLTPYEPNRTGR